MGIIMEDFPTLCKYTPLVTSEKDKNGNRCFRFRIRKQHKGKGRVLLVFLRKVAGIVFYVVLSIEECYYLAL